MFRLLLIFSLLILFANPARAEMTPPKFSDICPAKYVDVEYKKRSLAGYSLIGAGIPVTIVAIPVGFGMVMGGLAKIKGTKENNYWYKRKLVFENQVSQCMAIPGEDTQKLCYIQLLQNEHNKTKIDDLEVRQKQIRTRLN
jgi:hypothetical protein